LCLISPAYKRGARRGSQGNDAVRLPIWRGFPLAVPNVRTDSKLLETQAALRA